MKFAAVKEETGDSNLEKLQILQYRVGEHQLAEVWRIFEKHGLKPILIKGWAAAQFYPRPYERHLGDFDIAVAPDRYLEGLKVIESERLGKVDLHKGLRHLDTLPWEDLMENSFELFCETVKVRVLRPEDHLRVLAVHWLTDGGEYFGKLRDILYLLENRPTDFDWDRCLKSVEGNRRRWIVITIGLTHKYLGLDLSDLPIAEEAGKLPPWLTRFLENEWQKDYHLVPLHTVVKDKRQLWKQVWKRFPPNPVQATVEMEGKLESKIRFHYQLGSFVKRIFPSLKRIWGVYKTNR